MLSLNFQMDIGGAIAEIAKALSQRAEESNQYKDNLLVNLRLNLEIISRIVTELEDIFIELLRYYRDQETLQDPEVLKNLAKQTQIFLESRELLKIFEPAIGGVERAAEGLSVKGKEYKQMMKDLQKLSDKLTVYRQALGEGGITGPGVLQLSTLKWLADRKLNNKLENDSEITKLAQQAFEEYDWTLSSEIRKLTGRVILLTPSHKPPEM